MAQIWKPATPCSAAYSGGSAAIFAADKLDIFGERAGLTWHAPVLLNTFGLDTRMSKIWEMYQAP